MSRRINFIEELKLAIYDLPFKSDSKVHQVAKKARRADKTLRQRVAHFCEHDGLCIEFTPARASWHALAPSAIRPWWLALKPLRMNKKVK